MKNALTGRIGGFTGEVAEQGFTLIELLVVVLIIGILAGVALPQYNAAVEKARVARMLPLFKSVLNAQEANEMATGTVSIDIDDLDVSFPYESVKEQLPTRTIYQLKPGYGTLSLSSNRAIFWNSEREYIIDYFGKPTGTRSYSGLCYARADGTPAERICKSMGTLHTQTSMYGTNVYVFNY